MFCIERCWVLWECCFYCKIKLCTLFCRPRVRKVLAVKIVALDIGDVWTGVAISDALEIIARPLTTVATKELDSFLTSLIDQEKITLIVVGNPITMRGTKSAQTEKVQAHANQLRETFGQIEWVLWDERLSSQHAERIAQKPARRPEDKKIAHARAAAFILSCYLEYRRTYQSNVPKMP